MLNNTSRIYGFHRLHGTSDTKAQEQNSKRTYFSGMMKKHAVKTQLVVNTTVSSSTKQTIRKDADTITTFIKRTALSLQSKL